MSETYSVTGWGVHEETAMTLEPVTSYQDLIDKAYSDPEYADLAIRTAAELGGEAEDLDSALRWLGEYRDQMTEEGLVAELNYHL